MKKSAFLVALLVVGLWPLTMVTCRAGSFGTQIIDVTSYGAVGDGATDDTAALQSAVSAANSSGEPVYFPAGTYICDAFLTCSTEVYGAGENSILELKSGAYAAGVYGLIALDTGGYIHDMAINGNVANNVVGTNRPGGMVCCVQPRTRVENMYIYNSPSYGISIYDTSDCIVRGCRVINTYYDGIEMIDDKESNSDSRFTLSDCVVDTARSGICWWGDDASKTPPVSWIYKIAITGCQVKNCTEGGIWGTCGEDVTVTGCAVDTCSDVCIDFEGGINCTASGNTVREGYNSGFYALYGGQNIVFSGNTVYCCDTGGPGDGIQIADSRNDTVTITGNTILGYQTSAAVTVRGIDVQDGTWYADGSDPFVQKNMVISNNTLTNAIVFCLLPHYTSISNNWMYLTTTNTTQMSGIELDGCTDCSIEGNHVVRTTADSGTDTFTAGIDLRIGWLNATTHNGSATETGTLRTTIKNNYVAGFINSITDRGTTGSTGSDADQLIVGNLVSGKIQIIDMSTSSTVYKETNGSTEANRKATTPATLITPTTL